MTFRARALKDDVERDWLNLTMSPNDLYDLGTALARAALSMGAERSEKKKLK